METVKETLARLPHAPGVYLFKNIDGVVIYVGKAIDLARRVRQYFGKRSDDRKTEQLVGNINRIEIRKTLTEFDALLLEASLIHSLQPRYNSIAKDDRSPLYIVIALHDKLPRVFVSRKNALKNYHPKDFILGPFLSGRVVRQLLRDLRHVVPYCTQTRRNGRPCFYTHLGLCDPCPSVISAIRSMANKQSQIRTYRKNIYRLVAILRGKASRVLHDMETSMRSLAGQNKFEQAAMIKSQLEALQHMYGRAHSPMTFEYPPANERSEALGRLRDALATYYPMMGNLMRIECVDISNLAGSDASGSLTVLIGGIPEPSAYRRFRIRSTATPNDSAMIEEVVKRRLTHAEWPFPDLLVVDGGKGQVLRAKRTIDATGLNIPVIGLAKRFEEIIVPAEVGFKTVRLRFSDPALHLLQVVRDEAHRFALRYHKTLERTRWIPSRHV